MVENEHSQRVPLIFQIYHDKLMRILSSSQRLQL